MDKKTDQFMATNTTLRSIGLLKLMTGIELKADNSPFKGLKIVC